MSTPLQDLVRQAVIDKGADGLCSGECGCSLEDFAPCGDGPFSDCYFSKRLVIPPAGEDLIDPQTGDVVFYEGSQGDYWFVPFKRSES